MEAESITADEITLSWKPPPDDGGEPVTNYILEKRVAGSDRFVISSFSQLLNGPEKTILLLLNIIIIIFIIDLAKASETKIDQSG